MYRCLYAPLLGLSLATGCGADPGPDQGVGAMDLALSSQVGDVEYRLQQGRFQLQGPETLEFEVDGEPTRSLTLPQGAYRLQLEQGWVLSRVEGDGEPVPVEAELLSDNPAGVQIQGGEATPVRFRFAVEHNAEPIETDGELQVGIEVDAGAASLPGDCPGRVVINEVDYDQEGSDEAEFVELLNTDGCPVALQELALELVNGHDGEPYARYALGQAADTLDPRGRLVLGHPSVLTDLPEHTAALPLSGSGLQNGPDAVRLLAGGEVIDSLAYGDALDTAGEGSPAGDDPGPGSLARCPDGFDLDDNGDDFRTRAPTPGAPNDC